MSFILWFALGFDMASAEYRVFELRIVNEKTQNSRIVHSTLDWIQYRDYYHLGRDEKIELVDHWMCWKRNDGFKPLCKRPGTPEGPTSETEAPSA